MQNQPHQQEEQEPQIPPAIAEKLLANQKQNLFTRELEFQLYNDLSQNDIQNLLMNQKISMYKESQKMFEVDDLDSFKEKTTINPITLQRKPNTEDLKEGYLKNKQSIYRPMKDAEIKELQEEFQKQKNTGQFQGYDVDHPKLQKDYTKQYNEFLTRQPYCEVNRQRLIGSLAQAHEYLSTLKREVSFLNPELFNLKPLPSDEQKDIKEFVDTKLKNLNDKYYFLEEDRLAADDIQKKVKEYLDANYFKNVIKNTEE